MKQNEIKKFRGELVKGLDKRIQIELERIKKAFERQGFFKYYVAESREEVALLEEAGYLRYDGEQYCGGFFNSAKDYFFIPTQKAKDIYNKIYGDKNENTRQI